MDRSEQITKLLDFIDITIRNELSSYLIYQDLILKSGLSFSVGVVERKAVDYLLSIKGLDESDCRVIRENIMGMDFGRRNADSPKAYSIVLYLDYSDSGDQEMETILIEPTNLNDDNLFLTANLHYIKYITGEPQTIRTKIPIGDDGNLSLVVGSCGKIGDFILSEYILKLIAYDNFSSIDIPTFGLCVDYGRSLRSGDVQFFVSGDSEPTKNLGISHVKISEEIVNNSTPTVKIELFDDNLKAYPLYIKFDRSYSTTYPTATVTSISIAGSDFEWIRSDDGIDLLLNLNIIMKEYEEQ